ncbi:MAG: dTDP-glucose 4,6-dehydratase [Myxococcota bacterium]|jgi:dTDP-glucose 4,6-dehydratase
MRVIITGGAGFLGSNLCKRYVDQGADVVCIDNESSGLTRNIADLQDSPRFTYIRHDVTESIPVDGPCDLILHMASLASPPFYKRLAIETLLTGSTATHNCLEHGAKTGARVIFASTSEVYGDPHVSPQPESYWGNVNPIGPRSMYDESKRYGEALMTAFRNTRGVNTGIMRIFNTYGPRMRHDDGRVVTNFLRQIIKGEPLTIHGDGMQTRSFCFVEDLVDGITAFAASDHNGPMNLGNPDEEMTIVALAERLCALFDQPFQAGPPAPRQDENDPMQRRPDITLAREVLGWQPKRTFEEGMTTTREYLLGQLKK